MSLTVGAQVGSYRVIATVGAGGMGEVYRARDLRLDRDVALKILPDSLASDPERIARFTREAQTLAALNHANIAQIYGLEDAPTTTGHSRVLVLELVEGEDLSQRLARGPIPLDEVLSITRQIADALEAAHEQGIVHRDLKPANVKVRADGTVKVLDFGLAKAMDPTSTSGLSPNATNSPTITAAMTMQGVILGTAGYMSPEQARGRSVDRRADIWAFGVVVYEMLTGRRMFEGEDVSITLASVMMKEPDWTALPASTPGSLRQLMMRCLRKDPKARLRDIGEARIQIAEIIGGAAESPAPVAPVATEAPVAPLWRRALPVAVAVALTGIAAATVAWTMAPSAVAPRVARFSIDLGEGQQFTNGGRLLVAISPDGTNVVYVANRRLWLRTLSDAEARPIPGTEMPASAAITNPVFSPDGQTVAFWSDNFLKRIPVSGGAAQTICPATNVFGMSWTGEDVVFGQGRRGIMRVAATGGTPETIVPANDNEITASPQMLSSDVVMFTVVGVGGGWDKAQIVAYRIGSTEPRAVLAAGADARYLPNGHLIHAVSGTLMAVRLDLQQLKPIGSPQIVVEGVRRSVTGPNSTGVAHFAVSSEGTLIYIPGPRDVSAAVSGVRLGTMDRAGKVKPLSIAPGQYDGVRVSPDGTRIAFVRDDGTGKGAVFTYDLSGKTNIQQLTYGGDSYSPAWSSDSKRIVFASNREGDRGIFWQLADGTGPVEQLTKAKENELHVPESWSPRGDTLLYTVAAESTASASENGQGDKALWMFSLSDKKSAPFGNVHSSTPIGAVFSPNGNWVAYTSTQQSRTNVYVQPFPPTGQIHPLVPKDGYSPHSVRWSPDGKELFYDPLQGVFEAVQVTTQPAFAFGHPVELPHVLQFNSPWARTPYDVIPTTGEFIGVVPPGAIAPSTGQDTEDESPISSIRVVLHWVEELKERIGPR